MYLRAEIQVDIAPSMISGWDVPNESLSVSQRPAIWLKVPPPSNFKQAAPSIWCFTADFGH